MKKVLFVATVVKLHIMVFHIPYLEWFKNNGYEVHVAARNDYESKEECNIPFCDKFFDIPFDRFPIGIKNFVSYKELRDIINLNKYDLIHCHTPVGGAIGRIAAKKSRKSGTKIIYTAHGFHFYKGSPIYNWLLYYPIEKWLSEYTDVLITINKEDYKIAKRNFKAKRIEFIPGVGINLEKFTTLDIDKESKRNELGLLKDDFVVLSIGELNKNKNHEIIIKAIANIENKKIHYVICGEGKLNTYLNELSKQLGIENQVHLLGFRKDISTICKISNIFAFPSYREGLSVSLMEAMANGLPVICSNIRGNSDLIEDSKNGYLVKPYDTKGFEKNINELFYNIELRREFGQENFKKIKKYSIENVINYIKDIYLYLE